MKQWIALAGLVGMALVAAMPAFAQSQTQPQPTSTDCRNAAPAKVDGQVVRVDQGSGKVTVRDTKTGATHEFQTSREMLQTMKPGDKIEATLREAPKC